MAEEQSAAPAGWNWDAIRSRDPERQWVERIQEGSQRDSDFRATVQAAMALHDTLSRQGVIDADNPVVIVGKRQREAQADQVVQQYFVLCQSIAQRIAQTNEEMLLIQGFLGFYCRGELESFYSRRAFKLIGLVALVVFGATAVIYLAVRALVG